jgi:hypothetical protein
MNRCPHAEGQSEDAGREKTHSSSSRGIWDIRGGCGSIYGGRQNLESRKEDKEESGFEDVDGVMWGRHLDLNLPM